MDIVFSLVILIISVILHEVAHGYMANYLGDPTARLQGRLTLNPMSHIDPFGSIVLPLLLKVMGSPILLGYAKPVPYNPDNLPGKYDEALVAGAGPATNILLALVFVAFIRFGGVAMSGPMSLAFEKVIYINMLLALFNLIPIPPLDGSKVLSGMLPRGLARIYDTFRMNFERLGMISGTLFLMAIFYVFAPYFSVALEVLFRFLVGGSL